MVRGNDPTLLRAGQPVLANEDEVWKLAKEPRASEKMGVQLFNTSWLAWNQLIRKPLRVELRKFTKVKAPGQADDVASGDIVYLRGWEIPIGKRTRSALDPVNAWLDTMLKQHFYPKATSEAGVTTSMYLERRLCLSIC